MTDKEPMSLRDMQIKNPKEFARRYQEWVANAFEYDWWDSVEADFKEDMTPLGLYVDTINFSLGYCQSDFASVTGTLDMHKWMQMVGYGESHLALTTDAKEYGAYWRCCQTHHGRAYSADLRYEPGNTRPSGIFSDLPQEAWDELVLEQFESEDWDRLATEWVRERCEELYRRLCAEYEYLTSEEQFIEQGEECEI